MIKSNIVILTKWSILQSRDWPVVSSVTSWSCNNEIYTSLGAFLFCLYAVFCIYLYSSIKFILYGN